MVRNASMDKDKTKYILILSQIKDDGKGRCYFAM